ncbi:MAG TPA: SpoVR family protein [Candidatus Polarisedimenticolaceae bacterium]|nr:SpoVR family protein [Candidatus Polarisedimenticolaceae bacterium]
MMKQNPLPLELALAQERIEKIAADFGLTFFRTVFEMVDYRQMNALAAYGGFPTRYPHYRFGMEYNQLSKSYEYGLHKIYEMVINNDPTYAYLLEGNTMLDQKLVMAHVYGHADFFRNNMYFSQTNRKMIDAMANHATRIRRYQERYGVERVERFIDACLSVEDLIDPASIFRRTSPPRELSAGLEEEETMVPGRMPAKSYMDRYVNPPEYVRQQREKLAKRKEETRKFPRHPERDVLGFMMEHAPLDNWERDVVGIIREEAYYFLPQRQTKVMNEGWASYWHSRIMTGKVLTDAEVIDYADHHSGTVATQPGRLNPYKLGLELFRDIERRWDMGQFGPAWEACESMAERNNWDRKTGAGRDKIFEVRRIHSDITFLDEFLTPEFCDAQRLFVSKNKDGKGQKAVVASREFKEVKQAMLFQFSNGGRPVIELVDANYANRSELLLRHRHVGVDLRWDWAADVLAQLNRIWRRPVRLETARDGKSVRLGHDGQNVTEEVFDKKKAAGS